MKNAFLAVITLATALSCAARYEIIEEYDHLESIKRTFMTGNLVSTGSSETHYELYLNALRYDWRTGEVLFYLVVRYNSDAWMKILRGNSLVLNIDGQVLPLWGEGSSEKRNVFTTEAGTEYHSEQGWYQITPDQFHLLAGARSVGVKIEGESLSISENCSQTNLRRFREFVRHHVGR